MQSPQVCGNHVLSASALAEYWTQLFLPIAGETIIVTLGTCGGLFALEQREVVLHYLNYGAEGGDFPCRQYVFRTLHELCGVIERDARRFYAHQQLVMPVNVHFGAIFPGHHLQLQPLRADKNDFDPSYAPNEDVLRPREWERTLFARGVASGFGELALDVDLDPACTDRSGICECGAAKRVCRDCWMAFMHPAQVAMQRALTHFWGWRRVITYFSGRRGFHMLVVERAVCQWTRAQRASWMTCMRYPFNRETGAWLRDTDDELGDVMYAALAPLYDAHPVLSARIALPARNDPRWRNAHRWAVFKTLWPPLDEAVTVDPAHLHKLPLTFNHNSGYLCIVMGDAEDEAERFEAVRGVDVLDMQQVNERVLRACVRRIQWILSLN